LRDAVPAEEEEGEGDADRGEDRDGEECGLEAFGQRDQRVGVGVRGQVVVGARDGDGRHDGARYFKNKYDHVFTVEPASNAKATIDWVHRILEEERDIVISSRPLEATAFQLENIRIAYVFYESGLSISVMYTVDDPEKRAAGFKLSEGMEVPAELVSRFRYASQKSKLAGTIRGSFFAFKNDY
jgi:hypothetical protein